MSQYTIKLEQFEGPLDLLLKLIEQEELDISQVSLSKVTEQYIEYVQGLENELDPDELADFLVVAARLLLIKSRGLLPQIDLETEDSAEELERQLKMYKTFLEATRKIEMIIKAGKQGFLREKLPRDLAGVFAPPKNIDTNVLGRVFREIISGLEIIPKLKERSLKRVISIKEKIAQISNLIKWKTEMGFTELIASAKDRVEVIVSFLAILELVKQRQVTLTQEGEFGEIRVSRISVE